MVMGFPITSGMHVTYDALLSSLAPAAIHECLHLRPSLGSGRLSSTSSVVLTVSFLDIATKKQEKGPKTQTARNSETQILYP